MEAVPEKLVYHINEVFRGMQTIQQIQHTDEATVARFIAEQLWRIGIHAPPQVVEVKPYGVHNMVRVRVPFELDGKGFVLLVKATLYMSRRPTSHFTGKAMTDLSRGKIPMEEKASITISEIKLESVSAS